MSNIITVHGELGGSVIVRGATDVSARILRGAFVDDQRTLSARGMDANILTRFQFHVILKMNHFSKLLYSSKKMVFHTADSD